MHRALPLILLSTLIGCSSNRPQPVPVADHTYDEPAYSYPASALVFDPPIAAGLPPIDLSREPREVMAFAGFQQASTTFSFVRTDDRQSTGYRDSYDRRTISIQMGSSTR
jgi:hypothetical protein